MTRSSRKNEGIGAHEAGKRNIVMTEEQIKFICKWLIENASRPLTELEKEALKQAVDSSKNWEELIMVALLSRMM